MTSNGGMIVSALSVMEAMLISRSDRFSCATRPMSQRSENGLSSSASPRMRRISSTSPPQAWASRSSSTATASVLDAVGSRIQTMLRVASLPTRSAAPPSFSSKHDGRDRRLAPLQLEQLLPANPLRLARQALLASPGDQRRWRRGRLIGDGTVIGGVQVDAVMAGDGYDGGQTGLGRSAGPGRRRRCQH